MSASTPSNEPKGTHQRSKPLEPKPSDLIVFAHDREFVLEAFRAGEFDAIEVVSEIADRNFFSFLRAGGILKDLAESYPTPRVKEEVPLWFLIAADLALRLHGQTGFNALPYVVRSGGLLSLLSPKQAHKTIDPGTLDMHLQCEGFNDKNHYDRETPCDRDTLRKLAKDTEPDDLQRWFATALPRALKSRRAFDKEGIFIGDGSYLFVPDNPAYEGSEVLWFDEHSHPVAIDTIPSAERGLYRKRRCYKMVSLLHTNAAREFYIPVGVQVVLARKHDAPVLYEMVEEFIKAVGTGVMKLLILDRAFLDGEAIGRCRTKHGIELIMPLKKNMEIFKDAMGLAEAPGALWEEIPPPASIRPPSNEPRVKPRRPEVVARREAKRQQTLEERRPERAAPPKRFVFGVHGLTSWEGCPIPLNVVINREVEAAGEERVWALVTTRQWDHPGAITKLYGLRTTIEERHRQLKCFQDLTVFRSRALSMVVHHVVFILLTYGLLQWQLHRQGLAELNRKTMPRVRDHLPEGQESVMIFYRDRFAIVDKYEYTELLLMLQDASRLKILEKVRKLREAMYARSGPRRELP